jgi:hypothetical protein
MIDWATIQQEYGGRLEFICGSARKLMVQRELNLYRFTWPGPLMVISYSVPFLRDWTPSAAKLPNPRLNAWICGLSLLVKVFEGHTSYEGGFVYIL